MFGPLRIPRQIVESASFEEHASQLGLDRRVLDDSLSEPLFALARMPEESIPASGSALFSTIQAGILTLRVWYEVCGGSVVLLDVEAVNSSLE